MLCGGIYERNLYSYEVCLLGACQDWTPLYNLASNSSLFLFQLSLLLLLFPKDYLSLPLQSNVHEDGENTLSCHFQHFYPLLVRIYLIILSFLAIIGMVRIGFYYVVSSSIFNVLSII